MKQKVNQRGTVLMAVLILLLLALICVGIWVGVSLNKQPGETKPNGGYEVLYKSGLVEAGNHIQKITLSRGLAEGTYDAIIFVQPYRMDGITPTNNAETKTQLIVK